MMKYFKLLITKDDLFNLVIIIVSIILSWFGTSTAFNQKLDLNSQYPIFLFTTIATLTSAILDPLFELFKVESKKKKLVTIAIGVITALIAWIISFHDNSVFQLLQSISKRGGFSAVSISLLLLNLVYINYQLQNLKENEFIQEKEKRLRLLKENKELKEKIKERSGEVNDK
ncbi:hypothetical protein [Streptococcus ovis]|uniref:hypothetical protein n=1 Tax=Streptococcus ovis TaxID=82806 RepID=UPI00036DB833|nr:hypothetical protein [Streptococcus ovis]